MELVEREEKSDRSLRAFERKRQPATHQGLNASRLNRVLVTLVWKEVKKIENEKEKRRRGRIGAELNSVKGAVNEMSYQLGPWQGWAERDWTCTA